MSFGVVVRDSAAKDVLEAFFWYHTIRPQLGERLMAALKECYDSVEANPYGYQPRKGNFRHAMLRKFPYRMVYEIVGQEVFIYRIVHVKRKPSRKFGP
ncbi:MAG: type II toxin-antitoxin system RelE/ParE family toxin [Flavobacteriales bacterium]|jgi:plasmid stabilization system protein ParE|nr:type II toxin-antitoxin system RelE/ParE family toxin [Flavobacteriales bacterium]MBK6549994.1 type II toxin-antitoxin system RelE/ParE family toxin [Flavobacteriales bacterium]MBK6881843.1 type II toxin-antitoxin system RelE/ParE family toxin [Flavobacteriales bacterium]MBK7102504.1 type II toxin-antitoxin system RelE/ParE family toxin [Flavobacteriales bacterium]MBK7113238.1 type II toxin-antitoxin system RelE/ParE family toxin [Flavobacteriales bacterium]